MNKKKLISAVFALVTFQVIVIVPHTAYASEYGELQRSIKNVQQYIISIPSPTNLIAEKEEGCWNPIDNCFWNPARKFVMIGLRKQKLSEYNDYYLATSQFRNRALLEIGRANQFLNDGDLGMAKKYMVMSMASVQLSALYNEAAFNTWNGNGEKARETLYEIGKLSNKSTRFFTKVATGGYFLKPNGEGLTSADVVGKIVQWSTYVSDTLIDKNYKGSEEAKKTAGIGAIHMLSDTASILSPDKNLTGELLDRGMTAMIMSADMQDKGINKDAVVSALSALNTVAYARGRTNGLFKGIADAVIDIGDVVHDVHGIDSLINSDVELRKDLQDSLNEKLKAKGYKNGEFNPADMSILNDLSAEISNYAQHKREITKQNLQQEEEQKKIDEANKAIATKIAAGQESEKRQVEEAKKKQAAEEDKRRLQAEQQKQKALPLEVQPEPQPPKDEPKSSTPPSQPKCVVSGCSGTVCAAGGEEAATTCEFRQEYVCYKKEAVCERQPNGVCGWTFQPNYPACVDQARKETEPPPKSPEPPVVDRFQITTGGDIKVSKGDTVSQSVQVTIPQDNVQPVNFLVRDMPRYVSYHFVPESCKASCTTMLTIQAGSPDIPSGSYRVIVGTTENNYSQTATFTLRIADKTPPGTPTLQASPVSSSQIKLAWSDTAAYDDVLNIERKTGRNGAYSLAHGEPKRNLSSYIDSGLGPDMEYCYRIYFANPYVRSTNSQDACATTSQSAPPIPQGKPDLTITSLRAPTKGNTGGSAALIADVSIIIANKGQVSSGPFRLEFYWSKDSIITVEDTPAIAYFSFTNGLGPQESKSSVDFAPRLFISIPSSLSPGVYYLGAIIDDKKEVEESDETNNSRAADTGSITLSGPPPSPILISPNNGASFVYLGDSGDYPFQWSTASGASRWGAEFFTTQNCTGSPTGAGVGSRSTVNGRSFTPGLTYSWHAIDVQNGVVSSPSECRTFSITEPPIPSAPTNLRLISQDNQGQSATIMWQDNSSDEAWFFFERSNKRQDVVITPWERWWNIAADKTSTVVPANVGQTSCYRVKAESTTRKFSEPTNEVCVTNP